MNLGPTEIIIIAIVIFALFGYRKLPDAARSVGRSMRIFKAETKGLREDEVQAKAEAEYRRSSLEATPPPPPQPAAPESATDPEQAPRRPTDTP